LPNGYLVIRGKREVIVNYEMQEMTIQGIIRPADVSAVNTITSEKIAEARIAYVGKGTVDESQTAPAGIRFIDKWLPF
jgi:flagellar L-ring protein precursor FlgH